MLIPPVFPALFSKLGGILGGYFWGSFSLEICEFSTVSGRRLVNVFSFILCHMLWRNCKRKCLISQLLSIICEIFSENPPTNEIVVVQGSCMKIGRTYLVRRTYNRNLKIGTSKKEFHRAIPRAEIIYKSSTGHSAVTKYSQSNP